MPSLLALPPLFAEDSLNGPAIYGGIAPFRQKAVQPAGWAFWDKYEAFSSGPQEEDSEKSTSEQKSPEDDEGKKKKKEKKERDDGHLKLPEFLLGQDLYALLELDASASQDDIRKAYRKVCLVYHPDKQGPNLTEDEKESINTKFLQVQEAFEILNDIKKRRKYDSMGDFDDSIPKGLEEDENFFEVFGQAFIRNSKWSEVKPVPTLGDSDTPYARVTKFYDFWRSFQSWRDFDERIIEELGEDCFQNLEEAECREERRWMERENAKLRAKFQKDERARILRLVERAEKNDPRVKAEKERKLAEVEAKKAEKERQKRAQEEEKKKKEEAKAAEEKAAEEAKAAEKVKKEQERQAKKAKRTKIRKKIKDLNLNLLDSQLDEYLVGLEFEGLESLSASLQDESDSSDALFQAMRDAGFEPIIVKEEIVEEAAKKEEPKLTPEEARAQEKERAKKAKEREAKLKAEEEIAAKLRQEEAAKRAEEKAIRDAKKKLESEQKEKERAKLNKKEAEAAKKAEQKKIKEEQAAISKAAKDKEEALRRAEEQREKDRLEKEKEEKAKEDERIWYEFERARREQADVLEKLEWPAVVEAAQEACNNPALAGAFVAARKKDGEEKLDALFACLGSFFALGVRPAETAPTLSSGLRSRVKKLRTKLRNSAGDFFVAPADTAEPTDADEAALDALSKIAHDPASAVAIEREKIEKENIPNGETPEKAKKSKSKVKEVPVEENLDDLLKEFGVEATAKKSKSKSKKK